MLHDASQQIGLSLWSPFMYAPRWRLQTSSIMYVIVLFHTPALVLTSSDIKPVLVVSLVNLICPGYKYGFKAICYHT